MRDKVIMALSRNTQYILAGALAVYIVFFTRPAPSAVVNLLSSPLSQLAVLGLVVFIGAQVSLLVAVVAAIAVVLSIPGREYMDVPPSGATKDAVKNIASAIDSVKGIEGTVGDDKKKKDEEKKEKMTETKKDDPKPHHGAKREPEADKKAKKETFDVMGGEYFSSMGPEPAGDLVSPMGGEAKGSENFSLLDSSPF
jgi:hypothetical protein